MKNLINPLILIAGISYVGAIICKLVPFFAKWCVFFSPVGIIVPASFLRFSGSSAILAIALSVAQLLQAKKE